MDSTEPREDARAGEAARAERTRLFCTKVWSAIGVIVICAVVFAVMGRISSVLAFLACGLLVAYVASPMVNWMDRHRVPRGIAALLGVIVVVLAVVLLFALVIPLFLSQMTDLLRDLPARIAEMGSWFAGLEEDYAIVAQLGEYVDISSLVDSLQGLLTDMVTALLSAIGTEIVPAVSNIASAVFVVFLGLVLAYWVVADYPRINDEICRVLGPKRSGDYRVTVAVVSRSVGGYLRTTVIDSIIQGSLAFMGFCLAGHPYAGIMGVLSGVLNFLPVVGPSISAIIATVVALFYSPVMAFWTLVAAMVAQNVTDNLIVPRINQSTMQIHPVLTLTAIMLGSALMGAMGMVLALPVCAIVKSLFVFYFESRTGEQLVSYDGALFKGTPFTDESGAPVPSCDALGDGGFEVDAMAAGERAHSAAPTPRPKRPWERLWERAVHHNEGSQGSPDDGSEENRR